MPRPNWRDPAQYEPLRAADPPTLAGEFLKRNPDYMADNERLARLAADGRLTRVHREAFAAAWGVRFRRERRTSKLDGAGPTDRHRRYEDALAANWAAAPR